MSIEVRLAHTSGRLVVRHMMELYQRDFPESAAPTWTSMGSMATTTSILRAHSGRWEIKVIRENPAAFVFWQKVIQANWPGQQHAVTMDDEHWHGPVFTVSTWPRCSFSNNHIEAYDQTRPPGPRRHRPPAGQR